MPSYISAIGTATPNTRLPQMQVAGFMTHALQLNETDSRKLSAIYKLSGIDYRHTVLEDYAKEPGNFTFFPNTAGLQPFPTVALRMEQYRKHVLPLALQAAQHCLLQLNELDVKTITHLVTVSCTGMYAPGLDIELIAALGLPKNTQRTCVNFMGCYAAFNALKLADAFVRADANAKVLVVCAELCTLHFQASMEQDHLVSNALFADGAAAVLVQAEKTPGFTLTLESFYCDLAPEGEHDMAWAIGNTGFEMTLSSYVPDPIKKGIGELTQRLLQKLKLQLQDIGFYAIHPGGTRILKAIEEELNISREANRFSYEVLRNYGNMSSVTVLFVLKELLDNLTETDAGKNVLSFAFGPGLTLESMLLKTYHVQP